MNANSRGGQTVSSVYSSVFRNTFLGQDFGWGRC